MRKAELVLQPDSTFLQCLVWGDISWFIHARTYPSVDHPDGPSLELLESMNRFCYVLITPTNSKCDATGETWGTHPMAIPFEMLSSNAAFRLRARWLKLNIARHSLADRKSMPLFADGQGRALKPDALDAQYRSLLKHVLPRTHELYSLHSHRIRLACRLRRINASDGRIQAMCRWSSVESLHIYARWDIHEYADWVRRSRKANATTLETTNLPALGDEYGSTAAALTKFVERNKGAKPATKRPADFELFPTQNSEPPKPKAVDTGLGNQPSRTAFVPHSIREVTNEHIGDCARCRLRPPSARIDLAARVTAIRRHAPAKCYWVYAHPDLHGHFDSVSGLMSELGRSGRDNSRQRLPTAPVAVPRVRSIRKRRVRVASKRKQESPVADARIEVGPVHQPTTPPPLRVMEGSPSKRTRSVGPAIDHVASGPVKRPILMSQLN